MFSHTYGHMGQVRIDLPDLGKVIRFGLSAEVIDGVFHSEKILVNMHDGANKNPHIYPAKGLLTYSAYGDSSNRIITFDFFSYEKNYNTSEIYKIMFTKVSGKLGVNIFMLSKVERRLLSAIKGEKPPFRVTIDRRYKNLELKE